MEKKTPQKTAELENPHVTNLEKVTATPYHTEPSTLPLEINTVKKVAQHLIFMVKAKKIRRKHIAKKIKAVEIKAVDLPFTSCCNNIGEHQIHSYYLCKISKCTEVNLPILEKAPKKNKF